MDRITVRRHQADAARSSSDFVIHAGDPAQLDRRLVDFLRTAQAERGVGVWSNADPEIWVRGALFSQLERDGNIAQHVRRLRAFASAS
jgi:hypothetical protein